MKKIRSTIFIVLSVLLVLSSCKMRPKDVERLQAQAEAGNLKSMEVLMCHGDGVAPDSLLLRYTDILAAAGNYKALTYQLMQEQQGSMGWELMRDKKETARYIRWMKKGAEKGNPDCMYQLAGEYKRKKIASPNSTFVDNPYYDADLAMKWTRQAADSCHAFARNSLKYKDGTVNVLSRPRFVFRQIWDYNARGQSFFCKASNAAFHFLQDCFSNSLSTIVSRRWWQGLLMLLVMGSSLMTFTTTPTQLTDGLEKLFAPLKIFKVPVHEIAMMMSIALRFIPILLEETDKIMKAQQARGASFDEGNIFKRAKAMVPILVPLFVSAFRRASDLAMAMEVRCYHGGEGRTRMKPLRYKLRDFFGYLVLAAYFAVCIITGIYLG